MEQEGTEETEKKTKVTKSLLACLLLLDSLSPFPLFLLLNFFFLVDLRCRGSEI